MPQVTAARSQEHAVRLTQRLEGAAYKAIEITEADPCAFKRRNIPIELPIDSEHGARHLLQEGASV
jgi:hypothetical protein